LKNENNQMQDLPIDHDTQWKTLIEKLPSKFTAFFLPHIYPLVDWDKSVEFLEQEFHKIIADKYKSDKVINDKLLKFHLKSGGEQWILVHVEVESSAKANVPERMFVYFYRIFDKEGKIITALAIFAGDSAPKNYDRYEYDLLGTELTYKYNTYCVKDADEEELLKSDNPFALAVLAAIYVNRSKKKGDQRLQHKLKLMDLLRKGNYSEKEIEALIQFILFLMVLPKEMEQKFEHTVQETYDIKDNKMDAASRAKMNRFGDILVRAMYGDEMADTIIKERKRADEFEAAAKLAAKAAAKAVAEATAKATAKAAKEKKEAAAKLAKEKEEAVITMLTKTDLSIQQIADIQKLSEEEIRIIQSKINNK